jgi:hypothetical protein
MSQPIVVTLPHQLGKAEALRRLKASFSDAQSGAAGLFVFKNQWSGDHPPASQSRLVTRPDFQRGFIAA